MKNNELACFLAYKEQINLLSDKQAGELLKAVLEYVDTGASAEISDDITYMAFSFIRSFLNANEEECRCNNCAWSTYFEEDRNWLCAFDVGDIFVTEADGVCEDWEVKRCE